MKRFLSVSLLCLLLIGCAGAERDASAIAPTAAPIPLSDDPFDFTFSIEGEVYKLPCAQSDFILRGWEISCGEEPLFAYEKRGALAKRGEKRISLTLYNPTDVPCDAKNAPVSGLTMTKDFTTAAVLLGDGQDVRAVTREAVRERFADYEMLTADSYLCAHPNSLYRIRYTFRFADDDTLDAMTVEHLAAADADLMAVSADAPAYEAAYAAPKKLSRDPRDGTVEIDGSLYRLPVPMAALLADGWRIERRGGEVLAAFADAFSDARLTRGYASMQVSVQNPTGKPIPYENALVTAVFLDGTADYMTDYRVLGIENGMDEDTMLSLLPDGYELERAGAAREANYYCYTDSSIGLALRIGVHKTAEIVTSLVYQKETGN